MTNHDSIAAAFQADRDRLWGLCYRMTGSRADADDLVQETFHRALGEERLDASRPLRPWLTMVATRLAIDALRRRQTRGYTGPFLAEPMVTGADAVAQLSADIASSDAETRYSALQSATLAFMWALEALTPLQRAVLVLTDVMGMSGPEVSTVLARKEGSIRTTLHRARASMSRYDANCVAPSAAVNEETSAVMQRFMGALAQRDAEAMLACLTEDVVCVSDGAGVHHAALKPVAGADRVVRFHLGISAKGGVPTSIEPHIINGQPAWLVSMQPRRPRDAPRALARLDLDATGRAWQVHLMVAPAKLGSLPWTRAR